METALNSPRSSAQQRFVIDDASKVGEARRAAQAAATFAFSVEVAAKAAIAATELANNLLRHARGGELLLQVHGTEERAVLELLALDKGPGMEDVERCMRDGFSTAGTPGTGLGAVRRLADEFDIHSATGEGTAVLARFGDPGPVRYGAVSIAVEGEVDCGDAWHLVSGPAGIAVIVADGLGHGTFAAEAARAAIDVFESEPFAAPRDILTRANGLMSKTRGGAAACALLHEGRVSYAGLGNIGGTLIAPETSQGLISQNGTLGMGQRRVQQFEYRHDADTLLVMHSDGISARWQLRNRPDLLMRHPALLAGIIYRDHARGRDDATVVVVSP